MAGALLLTGLSLPISAAEWFVAPNGKTRAAGTLSSPWDLESALSGARPVQPGDTVWIQAGVYKYPNRSAGSSGFEVRLAGTEGKPIQVRASAGQRVTIDGGLTVQAPATHLWLRDLEILVSENYTRPRRLEETGSSPRTYDRPWGGLNVRSGEGCKFINLVIHDNAQGVSWWSSSRDSELYGCIIYNNGWAAPDRGHGHGIYTQNQQGTKTISDCVMTGGYGYTLHAYGSTRADVDNYTVTGNICYDAGTFLIGGGKPSHNIRVLTNLLYGVSMQVGYNAPYNENCEVLGNVIAKGTLSINKYKKVLNEGNLVLRSDEPRPSGTRIILRPNLYDARRAHLAVFNWEKRAKVQVSLAGFASRGQPFRLLSPTNFYGQPMLSDTWSGHPVSIRMTNEFEAFVVVRQ